ncbi:MAG: CopG family transcriptional regulator [Bacteroidetes bacterium]|nr:CopG family transcriptional regulator [Bacteroidota bacterium]
MKRVNFYLSDTQIKELKKVTKKADMNMSDFVRRAIDEYLDKVKKRYNIK